MVAKKRTTLRNKAAAAAAATSSTIHLSPVELASETNESRPLTSGKVEPDLNAFLHQPKETKKLKQLNKQQNFLSRVKERGSNTNPSFAGISKSAIRRRKRNMREDLKPKMGDLLNSLGQEEDLRKHILENTDSGTGAPTRQVTKLVQKDELPSAAPGFVRIRKNEPNIRNQKGAKALTVSETSRLTQVLANKSFQQNTFSALRDVIKMQNR